MGIIARGPCTGSRSGTSERRPSLALRYGQARTATHRAGAARKELAALGALARGGGVGGALRDIWALRVQQRIQLVSAGVGPPLEPGGKHKCLCEQVPWHRYASSSSHGVQGRPVC